MKIKSSLPVAALTALVALSAQAAVTAQEAATLGKTLTPTGAEMAGNASGTIPAYTGGLTKAPASYKGDGIRTDPFEGEKPIMSIRAVDLAKYEGNLTETAKALLKRYPESFRLDVYKTHRTVAFPKFWQANTLKNATATKEVAAGESLINFGAGVPFPIPKTGSEVMRNHLFDYRGLRYSYGFAGYVIDSAGKLTLTNVSKSTSETPAFEPSNTAMINPGDNFFKLKQNYLGPARRIGEAFVMQESFQGDRKAWGYLPGQRRVKAAPDLCCDTPNPGTAGMTTFDDQFLFNGKADRFDFKLIGKKEVFVPYNNYKLIYWSEAKEYAKPNHIDPAALRWELHRVWVVEATLKPGKRHIYAKRVFYIDEDSWTASASDQYDARGQLFRGGFTFQTPSYDVPTPFSASFVMYDMVANAYVISSVDLGKYRGLQYFDQLAPALDWAPDALVGAGVR